MRSPQLFPPRSASYGIGGPARKPNINCRWPPAVRVQSPGVFGVHDLCTEVVSYQRQIMFGHLLVIVCTQMQALGEKATGGSKPRLNHICSDLNDIVCVVQSCFLLYQKKPGQLLFVFNS